MRQMKGLRAAFDPGGLTFRTRPDAVRRKSAANQVVFSTITFITKNA
jgi:hypothetical protein